jgi:hypothetical protein
MSDALNGAAMVVAVAAAVLLVAWLCARRPARRPWDDDAPATPPPPSEPVSVEAALLHPDPKVGVDAATRLGEMGDPQAVGPLLEALKFGAHPVRVAVIRAIERIGKPAIPALQAALNDPDVYLQTEAARILTRLSEPVALEKRRADQ